MKLLLIDGHWQRKETLPDERYHCHVVAAVVGAVVAVGSAVASNQKKQAAKGAANQAAQTAQQNRDLAQSQYEQTRSDYMPYNTSGQNALSRLNAASSGDTSAFKTSPGYQFRLQQGEANLGNSFAARGGAFSGNALKALSDYNQNMASNEYGNWWNQQQGLVNTGQAAVAGQAVAGAQNVNSQTNSNNIGSGQIQNSLYQQGDANASGVMGVTNAIAGGISGGYGSGGGLFSGGQNYQNDIYDNENGRYYRPNGSYYY